MWRTFRLRKCKMAVCDVSPSTQCMLKWVHHTISERHWSLLTGKSSMRHSYDVSGKLCPLFTIESLFYLDYFPYLSCIKGEAEASEMSWGIHKPLEVVQFLIFSPLNCGLSLGYHRVRSYRDTWNAKMQNGITFRRIMINFPNPLTLFIYISRYLYIF